LPGNLLDPVDVCVIFGNALDNAIEACANHNSSETMNINIKSSFNNGFLFVKIDNPVAVDLRIVNNSIITTKDNNRFHGIGLSSIKSAVSKYNGRTILSCLNGVFSLEIDFDFNMQPTDKNPCNLNENDI